MNAKPYFALRVKGIENSPITYSQSNHKSRANLENPTVKALSGAFSVIHPEGTQGDPRGQQGRVGRAYSAAPEGMRSAFADLKKARTLRAPHILP